MLGSREIGLIVTAGATFTLGVYVVSANPRRDANRVFGLVCVFASLWCFGVLMVRLSSSREQAILWGKVPFFAVAMGAAFFLYFSFVFPERTTPKWISHPLLLISPGVAFAFLSFTSLILKDVRLKPWGYDSVHGPLHGLFMICLSLYLATGILHLLMKFFKTSSPTKKLQLKYVLIGLIVAPLIGIVTNGILPIIWSAKFTDIGPTSFVIFVSSCSYAIVKHRLMDIDVALQKGTAYAISFAIVIVPLWAIIMVLQNVIFGYVNYVFSMLFLLIVSLSSILFSLIKPHAERTLEQKIFGEKYAYRSILTNFGKEIVTIMDLESLCEKVIETTSNTMRIDKASIFVLDVEKKQYVLQQHKNLEKTSHQEKDFVLLSQKDPLINWLEKDKNIIVKEEWEKRTRSPDLKDVLDRMKSLQSEICIPLLAKGRLIGLINFGQKTEKEMYSDEDIDLLETLANQTAIAIENAKLYEDLKKQKAIMHRADRLASLGTLTAGLAHEIRNPLVAIKTLTQLLPERFDDEEFRRDFVTIASGEVDRISALVSELLEFSRPTEPQLQLESIQEIMDGMILLISTEVKKRNLEIVRQYEDSLPPVAIDREQIKQVFLNILLNAIEATDEGGQVSVEIRTFSRKSGEKFLQVEIRDTGCGISEDHLEDVFTPFFTTKDKGSGLGLSISHQIIQEHRGTISVESRTGQGSSFVVNFPISQDRSKGKVAEENSDHSAQPAA